jgi:hypothetical protein
MIVCPIDCVNHHAFFAVKRYCKHSGKPCVLLERSGLPTFCKGIAALAAFSRLAARKDQSVQSAKSFGLRRIQPAGACAGLPFTSSNHVEA